MYSFKIMDNGILDAQHRVSMFLSDRHLKNNITEMPEMSKKFKRN